MKHLPLLLVALLLLSSLAPLASAGEAWTKETGSAITTVATDEYGDRIFVGTTSGMVYCYDASGSVVWSADKGTEVGKLVSSDDGSRILVVMPDFRTRLCDGSTGAGINGYPSAVMHNSDLSRDGEVYVVQYSDMLIRDATGHVWFDTSPADLGVLSGDADWLVIATSGGTTLTKYALSIPDRSEWLWPSLYASNNRVTHTISGTTASEQTDTLVMINVTRGAGTSTGHTLYASDCRADFGDIRFTAGDGVTELPYRLYSTSGSTGTFLVQVPSIPASPGTTTIDVYWGNPGALSTTSNATLGADLYISDDFNDGTIDTSIWTVTTAGGATAAESGGYLTLNTNGAPETPAVATVQGQTIPAGWGALIEAAVQLPTTYPDGSYNYKEHALFSTSGGTPLIRSDVGYPTQLVWPTWTGNLATFGTPIHHRISSIPTSTRWVAGSDWDVTRPCHVTSVMFQVGGPGRGYRCGHMQVDWVRVSPIPVPDMHGAWSAVETVITLQDTETLTGDIVDIDAPETGDWVAVSTTTKTYIIQITDSGFGTVYSADRTGTPYAVAIANSGANTIEGRGILADIFRFDSVQTGTYTAGGPVRTVAIAQKNGLYAAAGSDDGKYYVFSKDESSSWYLLHASDSEEPVTAIAMSWRGEIAIIGRADGSVIAFRLTEEEITGSIRVTVFKDNIPYRDATIYAERSDGNGEFGPPLPYTTDSYGAITIPTNWGNRLRITADDETREIIATPTQLEYVIRIKGPVPLRTGAQYSSTYDDLTQRIYLDYDDTRDKTHHVTYKIIRAADNTEVFNQSYTDADLPLHVYYQIPAGWTNTSYRVHLTASGSPSFTNTWSQWVGTAGIAELPGELDNFARMGIALFLILFLAGLFSYYTGPQGAVVVSLFTAALVLWGWLPLPPAVVALAIIWAFLGLLGRTSGET